MENIIVNIVLVAVLVIIVGAALIYLYKAKKSGQKCVGCPYAKKCGSAKCSCGSNEQVHKNKRYYVK